MQDADWVVGEEGLEYHMIGDGTTTRTFFEAEEHVTNFHLKNKTKKTKTKTKKHIV
jgi:hypothetical protein